MKSRISGRSFGFTSWNREATGASHHVRFLARSLRIRFFTSGACGAVLGSSWPDAVFDVGLFESGVQGRLGDLEVFRGLGERGFVFAGNRDGPPQGTFR